MLVSASGAKLKFQPDADWDWTGWDGVLTIKVPEGRLSVSGNGALRASDILASGKQVVGKNYKAQGFDAVQGTVLNCLVSIDSGSLPQSLSVAGEQVCGKATAGSFRASCSPSMTGSSPPIPDPLAASRTGKWQILETGQERLQAK